VLEVYEQLIRSEADRPGEGELHAIILREKSSWFDRSIELKHQEDDDDPRRGTLLLHW